MATRREKLSFDIKRLMGFVRSLLSRPRGAMGVCLLVIFILIALLAPLIAHYDPYYDVYIAGDYAAPSWLRMIPGFQHYSENMLVVKDPNFDSIESLKEWNVTKNSERISVLYSSVQGNPLNGGPGCLAVEYNRYAGETPQPVEAVLSKEFNFPYIDSPKRFLVNMSMFVAGLTGLNEFRVQIFLERVEKDGNVTSYAVYFQRFSSPSAVWESLSGIDSYSTAVQMQFGSISDPPKVVFNSSLSDTYRFTIKFSIVDSDKSKDASLLVYVDGVNLMLYGTSFGLLGTDENGRDIFSQLVYGTRISLTVGLLSAVLSVVIGLVVGVAAGYVGSIVDELLMRFTDMLLVLPSLPLLLVLIAVLGPSMWNLILLIGVLGWMGFARVVRSQVLSLKERPFVEAAKAAGAGRSYIMFRHIIPNVMSLVYVTLALSVPSAILSEAALSWLGLFSPDVMSWGRMLHDAMAVERSVEKWWWIVPPGICIAALSLSFILIGYAIDDVLNPRLRERR
ncbi:MAG: ABC transporter permease [Candidatus Bathyarchaeia archaeon]